MYRKSCQVIIPNLFADDTNALYRQPKKQSKSNLESLHIDVVEWMSRKNFP